MNKDPKYVLLLTENEKDLLINALYLGSSIHKNINHPYVSNRMSKLADKISKLSNPLVNCKDCDGYEAGYSAGLKDAEKR